MLNTEFIAAPENNSRRLMIALHGLGDSRAGFRWLPEAMQMPSLNFLLVDAPDPYYGGFAWYDLQNPAPGIERSRQMIFELLDHLAEQGFPREQIVLCGFSQGCLLTIETGARYPHKLAGLVGISGYAAQPEQLVREFSPQALQQRFLITHGTLDPLLPIENVRKQVEILRAGGLQIEWHEFVKEHSIAGEPEVAVIRQFVRNSYV
jgi:predicted esterase